MILSKGLRVPIRVERKLWRKGVLLSKRLVRLMLLVLVLVVAFAIPAWAQEVEEVVEEPAFDLVWINGFIAFFLPLFISLVKKASWDQGAKKALAIVVSAVVGVVTVGVEAGWTLSPFGDFLRLALASITQVWLVAQVAYLSFWEGTQVEQAAEDVGSGGTVARAA